MKNFSNLYIFCFSSVLVLLVAAALSFTSLSLEDKQKENIEIERQQNILKALGVESTTKDVLAKYPQYIKQSIVIKADGSTVSGETAEKTDLKKEFELIPDAVAPTIVGDFKQFNIFLSTCAIFDSIGDVSK